MSVAELWSVAVVFQVVAGAFAVRVAWAVAQRGRPSPEIAYGTGGLLLLALFFWAGARDAWLQMTGVATTMLTVWTGLGQVAVSFASVGFIQVAVAAFARAHVPQAEPIDLVRATQVQAGIAVAVLLALSAPVFWHVATAAPSQVLQADLHRFLVGPLSLGSVLLLGLPAVFLRRLWEFTPLTHAQWIVWVDAGTFPSLTTLGLQDADPPAHPGLTTPEFRGVVALSTIGGLLFLMRAGYLWGSWNEVTVLLVTGFRLAMLLAASGAVIYLARGVFFDVVLMQGLLLAGVSVVIVGIVLGSRVWATVPTHFAAACLVTIAAVCSTVRGCEWLRQRLAVRWGDVGSAEAGVPALVTSMARCPDASALTATVTRGVSELLGAPSVSFDNGQHGEAVVAVGLGQPDAPRGYLSVGARPDGSPFTPEHVRALRTIATHFAGLLEACDARDAKALSVAAEVRALRAQINPHFLFNALNTLADLAQKVPPLERAIVSLAEVFRYALEASRRDVVTLGEELSAIDAYVALELARHGDQLAVSIDVPARLRCVQLPPLLLQPLVENAVGHGLSPKPGGGEVRITAVTHGDRLVLTVRDDGVGCDPSRVTPHVGLANVRARVELAGGSYRFESSLGTGTTVTLEVPRP